MGEIVEFPSARMRRVRERIRRIRERYATDHPDNRLDEIDEKLRTIETAIAGLQFNRRVVLAERRAECRRLQTAERRREESGN